MNKSITKPKNVGYTKVPGKLWKKIKKHLPNYGQARHVHRTRQSEYS